MNLTIRLASAPDAEHIIALDHIAQYSEARREFIVRSIEAKSCYVAVVDEEIAGYGVLDTSFYGNGFIGMLDIAPKYRRQGIGYSMVEHFEAINVTPKLFTSTNQSNTPMQGLLKKRGFLPSGVIENLDEGDPELVYFKRLR